jgi:hypothetical protein
MSRSLKGAWASSSRWAWLWLRSVVGEPIGQIPRMGESIPIGHFPFFEVGFMSGTIIIIFNTFTSSPHCTASQK